MKPETQNLQECIYSWQIVKISSFYVTVLARKKLVQDRQFARVSLSAVVTALNYLS